MPVFTSAYANFARAVSRPTTKRSAHRCTRHESGRSNNGESCRTGTTANRKRTSGGTWRPRRNHYRYFKSCSRR